MSLWVCPTHGLHHGPICAAGNEIDRCAGPSSFADFSDDQRRQTLANRHQIEQIRALDDPQLALSDDVDWAHQPSFTKAFVDLTGAEPVVYEPRWHELMSGPAGRYNFTADDGSFT
jgi:hypothetical protein